MGRSSRRQENEGVRVESRWGKANAVMPLGGDEGAFGGETYKSQPVKEGSGVLRVKALLTRPRISASGKDSTYAASRTAG